MRIGLARNGIGQMRNAAGMLRRLRPEKRVTARSNEPQKKCTGLDLPRKPVRKWLITSLSRQQMRQKRLRVSAIIGSVDGVLLERQCSRRVRTAWC